MGLERGIFQRTELLLGSDIMKKLSEIRVIIFGIGGVGSWCAESLIRSGVIHLTIVDSDRVCITNINRQLHATIDTVGKVKTETLKKRLLEINPHAQITAIQKIYNANTHSEFAIETYDYIIDAIDSIQSKIHLIRMATRTNAQLFSSMGASLKIDPTRISVDEFWKVRGCPLGARIRKTIKKGDLPAKKFLCVYSEEVLDNKGSNDSCGTEACLCPKNKDTEGDESLADHEWCSSKAVINGTLAHITAIFGFTIAGLVLQSVYENKKS